MLDRRGRPQALACGPGPRRRRPARTDTGVTPLARGTLWSTGPALFVGGWALQQLWLFWVAPILGAAAAGIVYPLVAKE